jgi:hypothetical protein
MKKIRMGLVSSEDVHDTTIRGDDYVDEPPGSNNDDDDNFDRLAARVRTPTPPPAVPTTPMVKELLL